jgi:hypothetical protein
MARRKDAAQAKKERIGGAIGFVFGGLIGVPFGYYAVPNIGFVETVTGELDPFATAGLFCWLFAMVGIYAGSRAGAEWYRRAKLANERRLRRERYADVIASHEAYKAKVEEQEAREREKFRERVNEYNRKQAEGKFSELPTPVNDEK